MPHDEPKDDPQLGNKRNELIVQNARQLSAAKMIRFDEISNSFVISDLGRIAAKYYLKYQTMEVFSKSSIFAWKVACSLDRYNVAPEDEERRFICHAIPSY